MNILEIAYLGNPVVNYITAFLFIFAGLVLGKSFKWIANNILLKLVAKSETKLDDIFVEKLEGHIAWLITLFGVRLGVGHLALTEKAGFWIEQILFVFTVLIVAHGLSRLIDALIEEYFVPLTEKSKSPSDEQFLPVIRKALNFSIWIIAIILMMNNAGYNVTSLLAGLGLGGLAFAMASKDYIANIFGGMTVFTDRTFKIKDRVRIGGYDGYIEDIGLRSTRLKTFDGTIITIPNSQFTGSLVENVSKAPAKKVSIKIGITYETPLKKIEKLQKILADIAIKNEGTKDDTIISLNEFGDFSLNVKYSFYVKKSADYFKTINDIHMEILRQCEKEGIDFAYPTHKVIK